MVIEGEGMWHKGHSGDLIVEIKVEMPTEDWACKLKEVADGAEQLERLLPPKRVDVENPEETDEVELKVFDASRAGRQRHEKGFGGADEGPHWEDDENPSRPGCHQQ